MIWSKSKQPHFGRDSPEIERGELKTEEIETEVFFFHAAGHAENDGTFTNTQRLLQWRQPAVSPPGDCRSDEWFMHQLAIRLIAKAKESNDPIDEPLRNLDWWYPEDETGMPPTEAILAEINGWYTNPQSDADGVVLRSRSQRRSASWPADRWLSATEVRRFNGMWRVDLLRCPTVPIRLTRRTRASPKIISATAGLLLAGRSSHHI